MLWKKQILLGIGLGILYGCTDIKRGIGLEKTSPNSFSVDPYPKGLEVPPHFGALPTDAKKEILKKKRSVMPMTAAEQEMMSKFPKNKGTP